MDKQLKKATLKGLGWNFVGQLGNQGLRVFITLILVRLLAPQEFGVIAMVTVFSGFGKLLINFGFGPSIIQNKELTHNDLSAIFWLNVIIGVILTAFLCGLAPFIASFYEVDILYPLSIFIAFTFLFDATNVVQNALLTKELRFDLLVKRTLFASLLSGIVACAMAYWGLGVWSLATQLFLASFLSMVFIWLASDWRPSFFYSRYSIKKVLGLSSSLFVNSSLNYLASNLDNLLIGKYFGQNTLGLYSKSFSIISIPPNIITKVLSKVMLPAMAKIQEQKKKIAQIYLEMTKMIAIFTFPLMIFIAMYASEFVLIVFGEDWLGATVFVQIFSLSGIIASINTLLGSIIISQGRTDLILKEAYLKRPALLIGILLGMYWGAIGVALGKLLADVFNFGVTLFQIKAAIDLSIKSQLLAFWSVSLSTLITAISVLVMEITLSSILSPALALALALLFALIIYATLIIVLEKTLIHKFIKQFNWRKS